MWSSAVHVLRVCFTSQISARYMVYTIALCTLLILLLEKTHLDNVYRLQSERLVVNSAADRELQERLRQFYESDTGGPARPHNISEERFTLILQTYNRTDILVRLLNHYSAVPGLDKILVVWNNLDEVPPFELWIRYAPHPVPVVFLRQVENKMRNRLKPFKEIDTKGLC